MSKSCLDKALNLVNDKENYIILCGGKITKYNLTKEVVIKTNQDLKLEDYYDNINTPSILEVNNKANLSTTITILDDLEIKLIHLNNDLIATEEYINYHIVFSKGIKAKLNNIYYKLSKATKINMNIVCEEASCITIKNITTTKDKLNINIRSFCMRHANLLLDDLVLTNKDVNYYNANYLLAEDSYCEMNNVLINTSGIKQSYDYKVDHLAANTISKINTYGIAKNTSELVINCCGRIIKNAKNSEMNQKTKGLIMDLASSIIGNPILEIEENEVIANHGAAIGAIDEEELYYLMSRGLSREASEGLIVNTYIAPFYSNIKDEKILDFIYKEVKTQLKQ